eukprot:scaffold2459_cov72-Phaeocystis_antarctica.AAC.5
MRKSGFVALNTFARRVLAIRPYFKVSPSALERPASLRYNQRVRLKMSAPVQCGARPMTPQQEDGSRGCCAVEIVEVPVRSTAREEVARNAVEVIEVAEASLDHGEQMLAIARQKAVRLASIEGCKLLRQHLPCLRLVLVRVRDEMDLDALLVAAHWHTCEQRLRRERAIRSSCGGTVHQVRALSSTWARPRRAASGSPRGRRASKRATAGCCPGRYTPCPAAHGEARVCAEHTCGGKGAERLGERHQPECRLLAGCLLAPLRPARHDRVLGAGRLLLITPRVAQKGGHLPHRRRLRARVECRPCWWRSRVVGEVRGVQPAGGQAAEELRGAFERGVGIAAADERRDRRRLLHLGAAPAQAPQAAVDAATIAGRGEDGTQEEGDAQGRKCPVIDVVASLDVVCDVEPSGEHAETQAQ